MFLSRGERVSSYYQSSLLKILYSILKKKKALTIDVEIAIQECLDALKRSPQGIPQVSYEHINGLVKKFPYSEVESQKIKTLLSAYFQFSWFWSMLYFCVLSVAFVVMIQFSVVWVLCFVLLSIPPAILFVFYKKGKQYYQGLVSSV